MYWFSLILFFVIMLCLGYSVTFFIRKHDDLFERIVMTLGIGICLFIVLIYLFGMLGLPLNIYYFLVLSLFVPAYRLFLMFTGDSSKISLKLPSALKKKHIIFFFLLLIFAVTTYMYMKGSFIYPYLEDTDPYLHTHGAAYVRERQTFFLMDDVDRTVGKNFQYFLPYPPAFSSFMGMLSQTNDDVVWTLKFFNALILSLSILWFFFFVKRLSGSGNIALFATFVLASIPAYLSHFIFAHSLAVSLFGAGLYCLVAAKEDRQWLLPLVVSVAGLLMIQSLSAIVFGYFCAALFIGFCVQERRIVWRLFVGLGAGLAVALALFWIPNIIMSGGLYNIIGGAPVLKLGGEIANTIDVFTDNDFLFTKKFGGIDTQSGVGIFACILAFFGAGYLIVRLIMSKKERAAILKNNMWVLVSLLLLVITTLSIFGVPMPFKMLPIRWWAFFSFPFAIFSAYSLNRLMGLFGKSPAKYLVLFILVAGIIFTSFISRYTVQTSAWPPHVWTTMEELQGYLQLKGTEYDHIFPLCSPDYKVYFAGKDSHISNPREGDLEYFTFKESAFNRSAADISTFMTRNSLQYMLVDTACVRDFGPNATDEKVASLVESKKFFGVWSAPGVYLMAMNS
ncbi:hypothetical protein KY359_04340 [Candidatus Woesearchaeota archaeon]|nr:hypothetical protein [Candidatus Woesearchaeota archaeon]